MVSRIRSAIGVIAAVAVLALGGLGVVTSADVTPVGDRHEAVAGASTARPAAPNRAPLPAAAQLVALAVFAVVAAAASARGPALVGRQRRRPGDDGDDWRSLLLGAPPGLA